MSHFKCLFCNELYLIVSKERRHDEYPHKCVNGLTNAIFKCYSCDETDIKNFSKTQLYKENEARCTNCVLHNKFTRHPIFADFIPNINDNLLEAIDSLDCERVKILLEQGADPNYITQMQVWDSCHNMYRYTWNADGTPEKSTLDDLNDCCTPLRVILFKVSNVHLTENDIKTLASIYTILLLAGADEEDAKRYSISRYGKNIFNRQYQSFILD